MLPLASSSRLFSGAAPSGLSVKVWGTVSHQPVPVLLPLGQPPLGSGLSSNTTPHPGLPTPLMHERSPPRRVVPYRLPSASRTNQVQGSAPSPPVPVKL